MTLSDELFFPLFPGLTTEFNRDIKQTILTQALSLNSRECNIRILTKYPDSYSELNDCKLIHYKGTYGNNALTWAIANSAIISALTLLDRNVITNSVDMNLQINAVDHRGNTPLMLSIAKGSTHCCDTHGGSARQELVIDKLLEQHADVTIQNLLGQTALHYAAAHRDVALMAKLMGMGCDINQADIHGNTPLHIANFTEEQADAFLYDACRFFTRNRINWLESVKFRCELDTLIGLSTLDFVSIETNLPPSPLLSHPIDPSKLSKNNASRQRRLNHVLSIYPQPSIQENVYPYTTPDNILKITGGVLLAVGLLSVSFSLASFTLPFVSAIVAHLIINKVSLLVTSSVITGVGAGILVCGFFKRSIEPVLPVRSSMNDLGGQSEGCHVPDLPLHSAQASFNGPALSA